MPRYHFDLRADGITIPDHEGLELLDEAAAREEAARAAGEMKRSARNAEPQAIALVVRDGSPIPVCTVTVALSIG